MFMTFLHSYKLLEIERVGFAGGYRDSQCTGQRVLRRHGSGAMHQ